MMVRAPIPPLIADEDIKAHLSWQDIVASTRRAFVSAAQGGGENFAIVRGHGRPANTAVNIKSGLDHDTGLVCVKIGTLWPGNPQRGLPAHGSTIIALDPDTGHARAVIEGTYLNAIRTAAAASVAVEALASPGAKRLAIVGAGGLAGAVARALLGDRHGSHALIWSRNAERSDGLADALRRDGLDADASTLDGALSEAEIVVTCTASRVPLFSPEMLRDGALIVAMGADAAGKQELPPSLHDHAQLVTDSVSQSTRIGEFQHVPDGRRHQILALGDVIRNPQLLDDAGALTIFDSSGIALQDVEITKQLMTAMDL